MNVSAIKLEEHRFGYGLSNSGHSRKKYKEAGQNGVGYMEFIENKLDYEEYIALRSSASWENYSEAQIRKSISNSIYVVTAIEKIRQ